MITNRMMPRLALVAATCLAALAGYGVAAVAEEAADVTVYKTPWCGCCVKWVEQLEREGLSVRAVDLESTAPVQAEVGVPPAMRSCHTAKVGDYWVEGHVPPDLVRKLLEDKPAGIRGLAVPGMPIGSPGMEGRGAGPYDVMQVNDDGSASVHARRVGKTRPPE